MWCEFLDTAQRDFVEAQATSPPLYFFDTAQRDLSRCVFSPSRDAYFVQLPSCRFSVSNFPVLDFVLG